jgi:hypothetical protein
MGQFVLAGLGMTQLPSERLSDWYLFWFGFAGNSLMAVCFLAAAGQDGAATIHLYGNSRVRLFASHGAKNTPSDEIYSRKVEGTADSVPDRLTLVLDSAHPQHVLSSAATRASSVSPTTHPKRVGLADVEGVYYHPYNDCPRRFSSSAR